MLERSPNLYNNMPMDFSIETYAAKPFWHVVHIDIEKQSGLVFIGRGTDKKQKKNTIPYFYNVN